MGHLACSIFRFQGHLTKCVGNGLLFAFRDPEIKLREVENAMNPPNRWACVGIFR